MQNFVLLYPEQRKITRVAVINNLGGFARGTEGPWVAGVRNSKTFCGLILIEKHGITILWNNYIFSDEIKDSKDAELPYFVGRSILAEIDIAEYRVYFVGKVILNTIVNTRRRREKIGRFWFKNCELCLSPIYLSIVIFCICNRYAPKARENLWLLV